MEYRIVTYNLPCIRVRKKRYARDMDKIIKIILADSNTAYVQFKDKDGTYRLSKRIKIYSRKNSTYYVLFNKIRYDVDIDSRILEQSIGADGKNELLRTKGYYDKSEQKKIKRPICPTCDRLLIYGVNTVGRWTKKIKKDGTLSEYTSRSAGMPNGQSDFLYCQECDYIYLFWKSNKIKRIPEFDDWFDNLIENIKW